MKTARRIAEHLEQSQCSNRNAVRVIVMDAHNVHCLNEAELDTWWAAHTPAEKAEIYEQILGDAEESCRFCGCTQNRACRMLDGSGCAWLDPNHTVCSAPACAEKYQALLIALAFGNTRTQEGHFATL